jgi:hypothetical protein
MFKFLMAGLFSTMAFAAYGADRTITVSGEGSASVSPDVVYLYLAVVTESDTVSKAMTSNKKAMNDVFAVLNKNGIADKDICTHSFSVSPKYKYVKDEDPKLVGHVVKNELKVTVRNLDKVGGLLDTWTAEVRAQVLRILERMPETLKMVRESKLLNDESRIEVLARLNQMVSKLEPLSVRLAVDQQVGEK